MGNKFICPCSNKVLQKPDKEAVEKILQTTTVTLSGNYCQKKKRLEFWVMNSSFFIDSRMIRLSKLKVLFIRYRLVCSCSDDESSNAMEHLRSTTKLMTKQTLTTKIGNKNDVSTTRSLRKDGKEIALNVFTGDEQISEFIYVF